MKKCPITFSTCGQSNTLNYADCIGADCSAYVERHQKYRSEYGGASIEPCNEWSCAMMSRELWHDVEENK